jgi:hypothetical protein
VIGLGIRVYGHLQEIFLIDTTHINSVKFKDLSLKDESRFLSGVNHRFV